MNNNDASAESLFSPSLISPAVISALPEGYSIRPLQRDDWDLGFLDVLRVLTTVGEVSKADFQKRFDEMKAGAGGYHVLVILDGDHKIVGTGALIVERKLYVVSSTSSCRVDTHLVVLLLGFADMSLSSLQHPPARRRRTYRGHRCSEGPTGQKAWAADYSGLGLCGREHRVLQDDLGLFGGERGVLCQVWV